ncbi:TPA: hypothetical protein ACTYAA_001709 [Citrobacter freundii]
MDLTGFKTTVDTIKNALEIIRKAIQVKDEIAADRAAADIYSKLNAVQSQLLSLYSEYESISRVKDSLENELEKLKRDKVELARYELHSLPAGSIVYRLKPEHQSTELVHCLCPVCFGNNIKSMLQVGNYVNSHSTLQCLKTDCQAVYLNERIEQPAITVRHKPRRDWDAFI